MRKLMLAAALLLHLAAAVMALTAPAKGSDEAFLAGVEFGRTIGLETYRPLGFGDDDSLRNTADLYVKNPKLMDAHLQLKVTAGYLWAYFDFLVFTSIRSFEEQKRMVKLGRSKTLNSRHLAKHCKGYRPPCSMAIDVVPRDPSGKLLWNDNEQMAFFAGAFVSVHDRLKEKFGWDDKWVIRWGGNFRMNCRTYSPGGWDKYHFGLFEDRVWDCVTRPI